MTPSSQGLEPATFPGRFTEPPVPIGEPLQPGDLVFFGADTSDITHVGIVVSQTEMIDAPHPGTDVRSEPYDWPDYLGATRPI